MKNLTVLILLLLVIAPNNNYSQDSSKIIILSDDVGLIVDSMERQEYEIFPNFENNFISAVYYLGPDSQCYCSVKLKDGDSVKDSVINLGYNSIRNTAVRVQSLESKKRGNKNFNIQNVELKFADGTEAKNLAEDQNRISIDRKYTTGNLRKLPINKLNLDYSEIIKKDFDVGISAGIIYNSAKFDGLGEIFNLLEENIPEAPYEIPKSNLTFRAYPLYRLSSIFIYKNTVMGELEYAFNLHNDNYSNLDYKSFAFSMSYLFTITKNLHPYVAIGYSASKFEVKKNYNVIVNSNGLKLESITLQGNVKGLKASLGTIYNFTKHTGVNIWGSYKFYPKVEVNQQSSNYIINPPKVNMKGFELGLSIYFKM